MYKFYIFYTNKTILLSNHEEKEIREKYGRSYEILNSFKDANNLPIVRDRILRGHAGFDYQEWIFVKRYHTEETKQKFSEQRKGKKKSEEHKEKIAKSRAGKGNFAGKKHTDETKFQLSMALIGNKRTQGLIWIHDPDTLKEYKIPRGSEIPRGFVKGRNENAKYNFSFKTRKKMLY